MKIAGSEISTLSSWEHDEVKRSITERSSLTRDRGREASSQERRVTGAFVERIDISKEARELQGSYSHNSVRTLSETTAPETSPGNVDKNQISITEEIIGSIIDKDVVLGNVKNSSKRTPFPSRGNSLRVSLKTTEIHYEMEKMEFKSKGSVTTEDGRSIDFDLAMIMNRSFFSEKEQEQLIDIWQEDVNLKDPLVINFEGNAPRLSDISFEFDLNSDGKNEDLHFLQPGSGFLSLDKNDDGIINNGTELFGPGTGDGFNELAVFDSDKNMWIDENDPIYDKLTVWTKDKRGNDRLTTLRDAGIGAISLENTKTPFSLKSEDNTLRGVVRSTSVFLHEDGGAGTVQQIDLADVSKTQGKEQVSLENKALKKMAEKFKETARAIEEFRTSGVSEVMVKDTTADNPIKILEKMIDDQIKRIRKVLNIDIKEEF